MRLGPCVFPSNEENERARERENAGPFVYSIGQTGAQIVKELKVRPTVFALTLLDFRSEFRRRRRAAVAYACTGLESPYRALSVSPVFLPRKQTTTGETRIHRR